jgi:hypothetical protein
MADEVKEAANANTTAAARRQYNKGDAANRALKASVSRPAKARATRAVAAPAKGRKAAKDAMAAPTTAELAEGGYVRPTGTDHSYGALDTRPPGAEEISRAKTKEHPKESRKKGSRRK